MDCRDHYRGRQIFGFSTIAMTHFVAEELHLRTNRHLHQCCSLAVKLASSMLMARDDSDAQF